MGEAERHTYSDPSRAKTGFRQDQLLLFPSLIFLQRTVRGKEQTIYRHYAESPSNQGGLYKSTQSCISFFKMQGYIFLYETFSDPDKQLLVPSLMLLRSVSLPHTHIRIHFFIKLITTICSHGWLSLLYPASSLNYPLTCSTAQKTAPHAKQAINKELRRVTTKIATTFPRSPTVRHKLLPWSFILIIATVHNHL